MKKIIGVTVGTPINPDKFKGGVISEYDTVIKSQEEWDAMVASENWSDAKNILLMCDIASVSEGTGGMVLNIPANVSSIDGNGYKWGMFECLIAALGTTSIRNFKCLNSAYTIFNNISGMYGCNVKAAQGVSFKSCTDVIDCYFTGEPIEFDDCKNVVIYGTDTANIKNTCINVFYSKNTKDLSTFNNDVGFITEKALPTKLSQLDNDKGYLFVDSQGNVYVSENFALSTTSANGYIGFYPEPGTESSSIGVLRANVFNMNTSAIQIGVDSDIPTNEDEKAYIVFIDNKGEIWGCKKVAGLTAPVEDDEAVNKKYVDDIVGDIDAVLDELHNYAQTLVSGGEV